MPVSIHHRTLSGRPQINLVTIKAFGGWAKAQPEFFGDGGIFDQVYAQGT